ncbi:MAG: hypothetical protein GEV07_04040 [Streptosporangiales bacterium]|nr:hypothetical protein [Streptosporangiales bacterium]
MEPAALIFLATGIVVVAVVGWLMMLTGRRYVGGAGGAGSNVGSVAGLLAVVFLLVTLGITALITVLPVGDGVSGYLVRLGILLVVLGLVYGVFVGALARRREVAITEAALAEAQEQEKPHEPPSNPSVPTHSPSYLPPSGLPGDGT